MRCRSARAGRGPRVPDYKSSLEDLAAEGKQDSVGWATHLLLSPLELIEKLAALIPPPRLNRVRQHGILAPQARPGPRPRLRMGSIYQLAATRPHAPSR